MSTTHICDVFTIKKNKYESTIAFHALPTETSAFNVFPQTASIEQEGFLQ